MLKMATFLWKKVGSLFLTVTLYCYLKIWNGKKSKKGTLIEGRNILKLHEADRVRKNEDDRTTMG